jgi:translocation and assembly module TamB
MVFSAIFVAQASRLAQRALQPNGVSAHLTQMQDAAEEAQIAQDEPEPFRGRRWQRLVYWAVAALFVVLLLIAWWQRNSIADRFVQNELESRGVTATYKIDQVGFRTQRIRDLVIGDPANPDLVAKLVEVDVALNFSGANLRDVRADGVKLRGRYVDGKLSFGELDKFADPDSKEPFEWPDIGLAVKNAQARIDTPWGVIGAGLSGRGLLRNRFVADLSLRSPGMAAGGCLVPAIKFDGDLLLEWRQPRLVGPFTAANVNCKAMGLMVAAPVLDANVKLSERFNKWVGDVGFAASKIDYPGIALSQPKGKLLVDGGLNRTNITLALEQAALRSAPLSVQRMAVNAKGYAGLNDGKFAASARGDLDISGGALDRGTFGSLRGIAAQTKATPVGPLLARMAPVLERAGDGFDGSMNFDAFRDFQGRMGATLGSLAFSSASGVRINQNGALVLASAPEGWRLTSPASLVLSGRDLPNATLSLAQSSGSQWNGNLVIAPYAAGGASRIGSGIQWPAGCGVEFQRAGAAFRAVCGRFGQRAELAGCGALRWRIARAVRCLPECAFRFLARFQPRIARSVASALPRCRAVDADGRRWRHALRRQCRKFCGAGHFRQLPAICPKRQCPVQPERRLRRARGQGCAWAGRCAH